MENNQSGIIALPAIMQVEVKVASYEQIDIDRDELSLHISLQSIYALICIAISFLRENM